VLAEAKAKHGGGCQTFMGVCRMPRDGAPHRRLDIKVYARKHLPFALVYFTGGDHFNRSARHYAKQVKKWHLNDTGLYAQADPNTDGGYGPSFECKTERDVFDKLGIEYREPTERTGTVVPIHADNGATSGGARPAKEGKEAEKEERLDESSEELRLTISALLQRAQRPPQNQSP